GHGGAEGEGGDEVEERGPDDRLAGTQHPGRDDRGDGVRRVVKPVDEVEDQRDADEGDNREKIRVHPIRRASRRRPRGRWPRPRSARWPGRGNRDAALTS